jgi:hypothetical protein
MSQAILQPEYSQLLSSRENATTTILQSLIYHSVMIGYDGVVKQCTSDNRCESLLQKQ